MKAIINAYTAAKNHIEAATRINPTDIRKAELKKMTKDNLIEIILAMEKIKSTKIEDLVKPILEDPDCQWLDYNTIAELITAAIPTANTSNKSIASYASKYPKQKGWKVQPRKTAAQRQQELTKNLI